MHYSSEQCIQAMQYAARFLGQSFTRREYTNWQIHHQDQPTAIQISRQLHGFNRAKDLSGLIPNITIRSAEQFTDDDLVQALKQCYADIGDRFSEPQYIKWRQDHPDAPHIESIRTRLGSLVEVKKRLQMGWYDSGPQEKYNSDNWKPPFLSFLAHQLNIKEYEKWMKDHNGPSLQVIRKYNVDSYQKALVIMLREYIDRLEKGRINRE